jgi:hypothetical protein
MDGPIVIFTQANREHGLDCDGEVDGQHGAKEERNTTRREAAEGRGVVRSSMCRTNSGDPAWYLDLLLANSKEERSGA